MQYDDQAIKDLTTLIEAIRIEVGIHLDMEGYDIVSGKFLISGYERDQDDINRWMAIIGANRRLSASLASVGVHIETEHDALLDAFYDNHGSPVPKEKLQ